MYRRTFFFALTTLVMLFSLASAANTPISKGALTISGGGTFVSISDDTAGSNDRLSVVVFYPSVGYFFSNSFNAGAQLLVGSASLGGDDVSVMAIGPQLTYYLSNPNKVSSYGHRAIPYLTGSAMFGQYSDNEDVNIRTIKLGAGVVAMLAKNIGGYFDASYNFDHTSREHQGNHYDDIPDSETSWDGNHFSIQVGLRLFIW